MKLCYTIFTNVLIKLDAVLKTNDLILSLHAIIIEINKAI